MNEHLFNSESEKSLLLEGHNELRQAMLEGRKVTIIRSDDTQDSDWEVLRYLGEGRFLVHKESVGTKRITGEDFVEFDSEKALTRGSQVTVLRSGNVGRFETDWFIKDFVRNKDNTGMDVIVVNCDRKLTKKVPYNMLLEWNK